MLTYEHIPFRVFTVSYKDTFPSSRTQFSIFMRRIVNISRWPSRSQLLGSGFQLFHNSYGVNGTNFEGTWLSTWEVVNNVSPQYEMGGFAWATIDLTMSNNILFFLLATPFCCGVLGIVCCVPIPVSSHKSLNGFDRYSLPWSILYVLILLSNWFSTKLM